MASIDFKAANFATVDGLNIALDVEREKYVKVPIKRDLVADYEVYQAWGYVVAGYFLLEESLKLLAHLRGADPGRTHALFDLYVLLPSHDKDLLREYYRDYRDESAVEHGAPFRFSMLGDFLMELDGQRHRGRRVGSLDWRYYFIENPRGEILPYVSIEFMHEVVFGVLRIAEYAAEGQYDPSRDTYSWRKRHARVQKQMDWLMVRMNGGDKRWEDLEDRVEIAWGPDHRNRCDLYLFKGGGRGDYFAEIPRGFDLPVVDKRAEVEGFDVDAASRRVGMSLSHTDYDQSVTAGGY
ncbi:MAG: hypothetical protein OXI55_07320 [Gammaproteobacteria bacterium]|nr:hypothetical protein [Gammaproteobacteria bacterium]